MISPKKTYQQYSNFSPKNPSHFSSVNKFDFPVPLKSPSKANLLVNQLKQKQHQQTVRKARYYWHMRTQHHIERDNAKSRQQKIVQKQEDQRRQKLIQELENKKAELLRLSHQRQLVIKQHGEAIQKAKKLNQDLQMKQLKSQQHARQESIKQVQRFRIALVKAKSQKQLTEYCLKQQHSAQRNEARNRYKSREREDTQRYKIKKQALDRRMQEQNKQKEMNHLQDKFLSSIQKKTGKTITFQNTCYHNFQKNVIVLDDCKNPQTQASSNNASPREFQKCYTQRKLINDQVTRENRKKSFERGRQALKKLKQAKQSNRCIEGMEDERKNQEFQKIQARKLKQDNGLKPQTMKSQMKQRQKRSQEQFEKVFFTPQTNKMQKNVSPREYQTSERKLNPERNSIKNSLDQNSNNNIYKLPYNAKIHSILLEKNRPSYERNLFKENETNQNNYHPNNKPPHPQFNPSTLDYSMTSDQNEYSYY